MHRAYAIAALILAAACMPARGEENYEKLYSVIRANDLPGLKALLDQGISPNTPDGRDITPLMYAAEIGSVEAMNLLITHGADVNAQNGIGSTALMWSATDIKKVRLLLDSSKHAAADVNKVAKSGRTALIIAAIASNSAEIVRTLLAKGANPMAMDQRHVTALNAAAIGNDTATIRMLVEAGADVTVPDTFIGWTPLMNAAGSGNTAAVKLLLSKGANVNAVSKRENLPTVRTGVVTFGGFTPLLTASAFGPPELVKTLLEAGAEVNVADVRGLTPLMLAAGTDRSNPEIVKMLLARGADTKVKSPDGETALDWAYKTGTPELIAALGGKALGGKPKSLAQPTSTPMPDIKVSVARTVALLDKTTTEFFTKSGCVSCHSHNSAAMAAAAARARGIPVDEKAAKERELQITSGVNTSGPVQLEGQSGLGGADNNLYALEALVRIGYTPNRVTDFLIANVAGQQWEDGRWHVGGYSRSPMQDSDFSRTAMAVRAMKTYGTPARAAEMKERIERAKQWLLTAAPAITEDWDMRLAGVAAAGATPAELKRIAEPLLSHQRPDGGWAQAEQFASDAYATGMTMSILTESGVLKTTDPAYQKAVKFLLSTQAQDGSWHVASRATRFQQYFQSGLPYEHDQWISGMAMGWAANALAKAIP